MKRSIRVMLLVIITGNAFAQQIADKVLSGELANQSKLLTQVNALLESRHYSPRLVDNDFSAAIWQRYIDKLDPRKEYFLAADISRLSEFKEHIDEEVLGKVPIRFLPAILERYDQRLTEYTAEYKAILSLSLDLNKKEKRLSVVTGNSFPPSFSARKDLIRLRIRYAVLQHFVKLQDQRDQRQPKDSLAGRSDVVLLKMAIKITGKDLDLQMQRLKAGLAEEKQFAIFLSTIVRYMDPHSDYLPPVDTRGYQESTSSRFYGTGARVLEKDGYVFINDIEPGSPAAKSGQVQIGDFITGVGQGAEGEIINATGMTPLDLTKLIRGVKGTVVRLALKKGDGTLKTVTIIRDEIIPEDGRVRTAIVQQQDKKIGYVLLPSFYDDATDRNGPHCAKDIAAALEAFLKEKVDGVVMDLRTNGGGSFREAVSMVKLFTAAGPVIQTTDRDQRPVTIDDQHIHQLYMGPLVVMVNELSASAAEIFSAAIQDHRRGIIIGSQATYGKGTSQIALPVAGDQQNGLLKITVQKFYRLNGGATQVQGVRSDIVLPDIYGYQKVREQDNKDALAWDTISHASYKVENTYDIKKVQEITITRIKSDTVFSQLSKNINWLLKNRDAELPMDLAAYRALDKARQKITKQDEDLLKLPPGKELSVLPAAQINPQTNMRYQQLLLKLSNDIYLDQAVRVAIDLTKHKQINP